MGSFVFAGFVTGLAMLLGAPSLPAVTPGGDAEPMRYTGEAAVNRDRHDGALPLVIGTHSLQVFRANRGDLSEGNGKGWTYNHSPCFAHWKGRFYLESITLPVNEADWPPRGQANRVLTWSLDGRDWGKPVESFPYVAVDGIPGMGGKHSEQISRSAFYLTSTGRMLVTTSLGTSGNKAVGRLVRELYDTVPPTFGPTFFIRYYAHASFTAETTASTGIPFYQTSADAGFKAACDELLGRPLITENWWEDELNSQREEGPLRPSDGFYQVPYKQGEADDNFVKAMWTFQRADGNWLAGWKNGLFAVYDSKSKKWSPPRSPRTFVTSSAKSWGQRTPDGRYALVFNPTSDNLRRWPLSLVTSDDGIFFDDLATIAGDVPPPRYRGNNKEFGPQYNRGIEPWNGDPEKEAFWVSHSINKEDLWVTRVPVPVTTRATGPVNDDFEAVAESAIAIPMWNVHRPRWAPVDVVAFEGGKRLRLQDHEPYDHAKAVRVFPEANAVTVSLKVRPSQTSGQLDIELLTRDGYRPVQLSFTTNGKLKVNQGAAMEELGPYQADQWITMILRADCTTGTYDLTAGSLTATGHRFAEGASSLSRLEIRTGDFRVEPVAASFPYSSADLPDSEKPSPNKVFHIDEVTTSTDTVPPRLLEASGNGKDRITLVFDEPLHPAMESTSLYQVTPALPVTDAKLKGDRKKVVLTLGRDFAADVSYALAVSGAEDVSNNKHAVSAGLTIPAAPPAANLRLWLDAGAGITKDESGRVNAWVDRSAANHKLEGGSADSRPRLVESALNGHPVVRFDGNDHLGLDVSGLLAAKAGIFIVFKAKRPESREFVFDTAADGQLSRHQLALTRDWLELRVDKNGGALHHDAFADDTFILSSHVMNGSASCSRIDAVHHRAGAFSDLGKAIPDPVSGLKASNYTQVPEASGTPFVLGARYTRDSSFYQGDIAEILIYDRVPDAVQLREVEAYLMGKYFARH